MKWASVIFILFLLTGIFANFIASEYPIYYKISDSKSWPLFAHIARDMGFTIKVPDINDYKTNPYEVAIFAPIPFSSSLQSDLENRLLPPLTTHQIGPRKFRHWLGTDRMGKDVAASLVHGCRKSLFIGLLAMVVSLCIGSFLGSLAGYWGNRSIKMNFISLVVWSLSFLYLLYLIYYQQSHPGSWALVLILFGSPIIAKKWVYRSKWSVYLPLDHLVMRLIEVFNSIPALLIIMAISSFILKPTLCSIALIIGLISWTSFARYTRGEILKVKEQNYILASKIGGLSDRQIVWRYILPEVVGPVAVLFTFGVAGAILIESTLSFLNIGVPSGVETWGSLLRQARLSIQAWWLAIFPGIAIFVVILVLQTLGNGIRNAINTQS